MSGIFGSLNLNDNDYVVNNSVGQSVVFEAANRYLAMATAAISDMANVFIEETTEIYQETYKLPGGGRLQRRGGQAKSASIKALGEWAVAYRVEEFGSQISYDRRSAAKMTIAGLQRHLDTVLIQYNNSLRFEILKQLFNDGAGAPIVFADEDWGNLNIQPLANGDAVTYPPVLGSETEATEDHYVETGYLVSAISDTNNPIETMVGDLEEHFGEQAGGSEIVIFCGTDTAPKIMDLTDFVDVPDNFISSGDNTDLPERLPNVPGRIIGRMTGLSGAWISQWRWMPATYLLGIHLAEPAPLKQRVPVAAWGLPGAIQLVSENEDYPFHAAHYETNFGLGCGNRLNGVVYEVANGGGYTIPSAYA